MVAASSSKCIPSFVVLNFNTRSFIFTTNVPNLVYQSLWLRIISTAVEEINISVINCALTLCVLSRALFYWKSIPVCAKSCVCHCNKWHLMKLKKKCGWSNMLICYHAHLIGRLTEFTVIYTWSDSMVLRGYASSQLHLVNTFETPVVKDLLHPLPSQDNGSSKWRLWQGTGNQSFQEQWGGSR